MRKLVIVLYLIGIALFSSGSILEIKNEKALIYSQKQYNNLFIENSPKDTVTKNDVDRVISSLDQVSKYNKNSKDKIFKDLVEYKSYLKLKDEILSNYTDNYISLKLTDDNITNYEQRTNSLSTKYKEKLTIKIKDMQEQKTKIDEIEAKIRNLYYEGDLTNLKIETTRENVENLKTELDSITQKEYVSKRKELLDEAITKINTRDAIEKAWVNLNVGYISQNQNNVLNGCEAASLLMALQYKGYLKDTTLYEYATNMPKSNNPYEGFTYDIYKGEPYNVPHWIAPEPLAKYGKESSGNQNIINGTGMSINELDRELDNGNPVVIYLTAKFREPRDWKEDAPTNLHVLLLTGYNKITGKHIIIDPWTHDDGRTNWIVEKEQLEYIYNSVGKRNVIIK